MQITMFSSVLMAVAFRFNEAWKEKIKSLPAEGRRWEPTKKLWLVHVKHFGKLADWFGGVMTVAPDVLEAAYPMRPASHTGAGAYWTPEQRAAVPVGPFGGGWWDRPRSESPLYCPGRRPCAAPPVEAMAEKRAVEAPGGLQGTELPFAA